MASSGKTAIVTGGGRGIGQGICLELASRGIDIVVADLDEDEMTKTKEDVERRGQEALCLTTDVTDPENVSSTVDETLDQFRSIEILVNNAGIAGPTAPCENVKTEEWDHTIAVNLRGPFLMCREVLPEMKQQEYGRIVNIASISGKRPLYNRTPYVTSKMGLIGLTRTLAVEGGEFNINVNAICPGPVEGPRLEQVIRKQAEAKNKPYDQVKAEEFEGETARGELVRRKDIAETVAFLCSDDADRITGQDINVSSGMVMY